MDKLVKLWLKNIRLAVFVVFSCSLMIACSTTYYPVSQYPPSPSFPSDDKDSQPYPESSSQTPQQLNAQSQALQKVPTDTPHPIKPRILNEQTPQRIASLELVERARELALSGKVDEALGLLERAIEVDAYNGDAFYEMARCWELKGNHSAALNFIDRAISIFEGRPQNVQKAYLLKAEILEQLGDMEESHRFKSLGNEKR